MQEPSFDSSSQPVTEALLSMAVSGWRFSRSHLALVLSLDLTDQQRHMATLRFYRKHLTDTLRDLGYEVVDLEGHPVDVGLPVTVLNLADFDASDHLVIDQVLEPVIMRAGKVIRTGTVLARRID